MKRYNKDTLLRLSVVFEINLYNELLCVYVCIRIRLQQPAAAADYSVITEKEKKK